MDYQKTYDNLIRTRKERVPVTGVYYERHHIIMTSMGGKNTPDNLVKLTAREHFLAHWLLWRIYQNDENSKNRQYAAFAFFAMCNWKTKLQQRKTSSRVYAEAKEAFNLVRKGNRRTELTRERISNSLIAREFSTLHRENIGKSRKVYSAKKFPIQEITCLLCKVHFNVSYAKRERKFCSSSCASKYRYKKNLIL